MAGLGEAEAAPEGPQEFFREALLGGLLAELVEDPHQSDEVLVPGVLGDLVNLRHQPEAANALEPVELRLRGFVECPRCSGEDNLTGEGRVNEAKVLGHKSHS